MKNYMNYCTTLVTLLASATITTAGEPALAADQPAETRNAAVVRVGIAPPVNQLDAANQMGSTPMRDLFAQYLKGPGVEIVPLEAMLPQQTDAEASQKNCRYVIYATLTQKRGGGGGMAFMRGATAMSSMIPVVGMAGGMAGAIASTAASAAMSSASSLSGTVKAKSDVSLDYKVFIPGTTAPVLANTLHMKAKQDGQDVITPLVAQANTEILAKMIQK